MAMLELVMILLVALALVLLLWGFVAVLRRTPHGATGLAGELAALDRGRRAEADPGVRWVARTEAAALAAGLAVAAACAWWGLDGGEHHGLPFFLAAMAGALAGLPVIALVPSPRWPQARGGVVVADLTPRGSTSFGRGRTFALPLAAACLLVVGLAVAGLGSVAGEDGQHRFLRSVVIPLVDGIPVIGEGVTVQTTGPFPGWFYGVPLMVGTLVLVVGVWWVLRRAARAARPADEALFGVDTALRVVQTRFVVSASTSVLLFQVAVVSLMAGLALRSSHGPILALLLIGGAFVAGLAALVLLFRAGGVVVEGLAVASGDRRGARSVAS
ncbi:hypothetical protein [Arthrobacter sp. KK5.5]|uniref:hypothetical protein n=1 Tax=Arthrobacter sp. KK5.5 TaxID=3373084 RepID=UPI003EE7D873